MVHILTALLLFPRNVLVLLLKLYRTLISPLYGDVCRYYPSCSAYTLSAVQQRGVIVGGFLGIRRILRCHPWAKGGVDDPPGRKNSPYHLTPRGFVIANTSGKA